MSSIKSTQAIERFLDKIIESHEKNMKKPKGSLNKIGYANFAKTHFTNKSNNSRSNKIPKLDSNVAPLNIKLGTKINENVNAFAIVETKKSSAKLQNDDIFDTTTTDLIENHPAHAKKSFRIESEIHKEGIFMKSNGSPDKKLVRSLGTKILTTELQSTNGDIFNARTIDHSADRKKSFVNWSEIPKQDISAKSAVGLEITKTNEKSVLTSGTKKSSTELQSTNQDIIDPVDNYPEDRKIKDISTKSTNEKPIAYRLQSADDIFNTTTIDPVENHPAIRKKSFFASDFALNKRHISENKTEFYQITNKVYKHEFNIPVWKQKMNEIRASSCNNKSPPETHCDKNNVQSYNNHNGILLKRSKNSLSTSPELVLLTQETLKNSRHDELLSKMREKRNKYRDILNQYENKKVSKAIINKLWDEYKFAELEFKQEVLRLKYEEIEKLNENR